MEATSNKTSCNESPEESRSKIKTNLEILLSQNDILPLLKKIHKEKLKNKGSIYLSKFMIKNEKVKNIYYSYKTIKKIYLQKNVNSASLNGRNARMMNKNVDNENLMSDSDDEQGKLNKKIKFKFSIRSFRIY
jgi:hypothetical protein